MLFTYEVPIIFYTFSRHRQNFRKDAVFDEKCKKTGRVGALGLAATVAGSESGACERVYVRERESFQYRKHMPRDQ